MKFSDFICKEAIRTQLEADEKESVIRAMGQALVDAGRIKQENFESIVAAILKREELGSTGIGRGVAVPQELRTGSLALGTTRWQTIRHILLPAALPGILTAIVLGMTRAAGEALAVQMVIGNAPVLPAAVTQPVTTLTSQITLDMGNTVFGEPWQDALWTMSLILLALSVASVVLVRVINRRRAAA